MTLNDLITLHQSGEDKTIEIYEHPEIQRILEIHEYTLMKKKTIDRDEIKSIVYEAFLNTLRTFKVDGGSKFSTMLTLWVRNMMEERMNQRSINGLLTRNRVSKYHYKIHQYLLMYPDATDEEIFEHTKVKSMQMLQNLKRISPDFLMVDCLDNMAPTVEFEDSMDEFYKYGDIYDAIEKLPEREQYIMMMRFGLLDSDEMTLSEIADLSGLTSERIRQIEEISLKKLKYILKNQD